LRHSTITLFCIHQHILLVSIVCAGIIRFIVKSLMNFISKLK
jgi:hypothetical protein